ncbi:hypothetical protein [Vibrio vulnificus]|uniref:hypothetical protein n=1 Tax=Vibrio vulnificus TaxID=672 RepID=UPI000CD27FB0|nr:hypothetical protein [Vibrio vulnificus]POC05847.1 hypothetical protein CRN39_16340 [Vibrio vulnificus]
MTTLVSWAGVDTHGPASIYIASDSRISWGTGPWDLGRKVFASKNTPNILGFSGTVAFPTQILSRIIDLIDCGMLFKEDDEFEIKLEKIRAYVESNYKPLPKVVCGDFTIIYATRVGERMHSSFHVGKIIGTVNKKVTKELASIPEVSDIIYRSGTGRGPLNLWHKKWTGVDKDGHPKQIRTSRSVFGAFCDSLASKADKDTGGAPQLVGLYRVGPALRFGVIYNNQRYLYGAPVTELNDINQIEWRNELFERCCGETLCLLGKAQRQPKLATIPSPS